MSKNRKRSFAQILNALRDRINAHTQRIRDDDELMKARLDHQEMFRRLGAHDSLFGLVLEAIADLGERSDENEKRSTEALRLFDELMVNDEDSSR